MERGRESFQPSRGLALEPTANAAQLDSPSAGLAADGPGLRSENRATLLAKSKKTVFHDRQGLTVSARAPDLPDWPWDFWRRAHPILAMTDRSVSSWTGQRET
jgi:hypothetical protein